MAHTLSTRKRTEKMSKRKYKTTKRRHNTSNRFRKSRRQYGGVYNEEQKAKITKIFKTADFTDDEIKKLITESNKTSWFYAKPKPNGKTPKYNELIKKLSVVEKLENSHFSKKAKQSYIRNVIKKSKEIAKPHADDVDTDGEDEA